MVRRERELLKRMSGALRNLQGMVMVRGNQGGVRVSAKLITETKRASRDEEVSRAADGELTRLWRAVEEFLPLRDTGGGILQDLEMLRERVE